MKENETLFDSFIANVVINNIVSMAAVHYVTLIFFQWTKNSLCLRIAMYNKWSMMNFNVKGYSIFDCIFLAFVVASLINIAWRGSGRIRYNDAIQSKEQRKIAEQSGKKVSKQKDILSSYFGEADG